jgi:serine/threonine protein phosphatase PrpC
MEPFENSKVSDSVGCTANVCLLVGKTLYVANAGDSRAALSRMGSIIELSYDHKPENPIELERIVSSGHKVEGGRIDNHLNLSRCLGDCFYKKDPNLTYDRQAITCHPDIKKV